MLVTEVLGRRDREQGSDAGLADALRDLAPPSVQVGIRRIAAEDIDALFEVEAARVERAVPGRQREFASGRVLLRELIGRPVAIPVAPNRWPVLPEGVTGSLAHDRELAIAAVSTDPDILAIGIDIEPATPLEPEIARLVLRPDEADVDPHRAFTMKEAVYKAWSTLGGRLLDHHDVRVSLTGTAFRAEVLPDGVTFGGWSAAAGDRWIALVVVRVSPGRA